MDVKARLTTTLLTFFICFCFTFVFVFVCCVSWPQPLEKERAGGSIKLFTPLGGGGGGFTHWLESQVNVVTPGKGGGPTAATSTESDKARRRESKMSKGRGSLHEIQSTGVLMRWEQRKEQSWSRLGQKYDCVVLMMTCSWWCGWPEAGGVPWDTTLLWTHTYGGSLHWSNIVSSPQRPSPLHLSFSLCADFKPTPLRPTINTIHPPVLRLLPSPKSSYCTTMFVLYSQKKKNNEQKSLKSRALGSLSIFFPFFCSCFSLSQLKTVLHLPVLTHAHTHTHTHAHTHTLFNSSHTCTKPCSQEHTHARSFLHSCKPCSSLVVVWRTCRSRGNEDKGRGKIS